MKWAGDDLNVARYDWPTVEEVRVYRRKVREVVDRVIRKHTLHLAHRLGRSLLGRLDGHRTRAHSPRNLVGVDAPACPSFRKTSPGLAALPRQRHSAGQYTG